MSDFHIRRLLSDDASIFRAIRLEGLERHPEAFGASFEEERAYDKSRFAEWIEDNAIFGGFNEQGTVAGVVAASRSKKAKTQHIATIWAMYVRPEARGSGLGRSLLQSAIDAVKTDCHSIRLGVVTSNTQALRLYESAGFRVWATDKKAFRIDNQYHDLLLMRLDT
ncbi:MAG: GNAT family N-acetyltransferase [Oceanibaculum nanhaiense]|uniref:GNAT family N-acetyltransferase n=1 Tax=Oceanibaculum nanhaiense TaxID=1909734 RepID=UPI0025A3E83E|nr:GNAT family N-acetyltransferase [Oceanibaculum nanhaiense]MDM7947235.1 GNAT family N-acetyltransferase [Oceanibaculum nanhaiense]